MLDTRLLMVSIVVVSAVTMPACGGNLQALRAQSAGELRCPPEKIEASGYAGMYAMSGCGRSSVYYYGNGEKKWLSPLDRATFDLSCPKDQIEMTKITFTSVGVSGCGKRAVYILGNLGWIINSTEQK